MRKFGWIGLALAVPSGAGLVMPAHAADVPPGAAINCRAPDAPYKNYDCLDKYLGDGFFERLVNYYRLEWGHDAGPADPKAPPSRRPGWSPAPATAPPYPFTEWPYGGSTNIGTTRPGSVDSPFMMAFSNTDLGKWMSDAHFQVYGWVNGGGNLSTNSVTPNGNAPAAYDYTPNNAQMDQTVVYFERLPDTVQTDHIDWGFRFSGIYGENQRYTTAFGVSSYQLLGHNLTNGFDFPMEYGELYIPQVAEGLLIRVGRYISIPDIEAQLAPNNYMYTHSLTYTFDNYTNSGIQTTTALNKNWFFQLGVSVGTESPPWHWGQTVQNPFPNVVNPGVTMLRDPGAIPSIAAGIRWQSDDAKDNLYIVADGINSGIWGYNNLQWTGITWYHIIDDHWHFSWETYTLGQNKVLNAADPDHIIANSGWPFAVQNGFAFNSPNTAICSSPYVVTCNARSFATVMYINYRIDGLNNISFREEFFNDMQGQRTGIKTRYLEFGIGWQHWLSPQIEFRPEVTWYYSMDANAFNGNPAAAPNGTFAIAPNRDYSVVAAMDLIWHF